MRGPSLPAYSRILVALDGSLPAEAALPHAAALARSLGATLTLMRVVPGVDELAGEAAQPEPSQAGLSQDVIEVQEQGEERGEAQQYLQRAVAELAAEGVPAAAAVRTGRPADAILEEARASRSDLIVITAFGRTAELSWPTHALFGGVADEVLRASELPVLVVHP
jgi:nucleotide-binding universal stress UspA family protein